MFALIIGINKYKCSEFNLKGAVPDAEDVKQYLLSDLGIPKDNIKCLIDDSATRESIIAGFRTLRDDPRIRWGDPILIYYAGHGSTSIAPHNWVGYAPNSKIELLLPHDYGGQASRSSSSGNNAGHGIPDRTIGCLLNEIAKNKGDNITVILDCCHSASGTRYAQSSNSSKTCLVRRVGATTELPDDLDADILDRASLDRGFTPTRGFLSAGLQSHVLLAACSAKGTARECNQRGLFTEILLRTIRAAGVETLTYEDLIHRLPYIEGQSPQCEGHNRKRFVFDSKVRTFPSLYKVCRKGANYEMAAGSIQGVTEGAQFAIYRSRDTAVPGLGVLTAGKVSPLSTIMHAPASQSSPLDLASFGYAWQITPGNTKDLRVYIRPNQLEVVKGMFKKQQYNGNTNHMAPEFTPVDRREHADLCISIESGRVFFSVKNTLLGESSDTAQIYRVIEAAARYFRLLRYTGASSNSFLSSKIQVEFFRLQHSPDEFDDDGLAVLQPQYPLHNMNNGGFVDLFFDEEDIVYGIKITSKLKRGLYAHVFLLDGDLSICTHYGPGVAAPGNEPDMSIEPEGCLTLGYGPAGVLPLFYDLKENMDVDVAYIKIFLSTEYGDLSGLAQESPFANSGRSQRRAEPRKIDHWHTILISVVHKRRPR